MKKYNLFYKTNGKVIQKRNMTKEEIDNFINSLEKEYESELKVMQVKDRDEEGER